MLRDNREQLVGVSVQGAVSCPEYPSLPASPYVIGADGTPRLLPSPGGIVYNVRVGDSAYGWVADMVQPGVSIKAPAAAANYALNTFACLGNEAIVVSGAATAARGTVTGKSGRFAEHVICHFAPEVLEQLSIEDKLLVRALGRSLALADYAEVQLKSISPALLDALEVEAEGPGAVSVPVVAEVPAFFVGAGSGLLSESGCVQIQSDDGNALREHGLDVLVNNAGVISVKPLEDTPPELWDHVLTTNLRGAYLYTRAFVPSMKATGGGLVINVSSASGIRGFVDESAYCASKFGLEGLTAALALELEPSKIRLVSISPGALMHTPMSETTYDEAARRTWIDPEEIAPGFSVLAASDDVWISGRRFDAYALALHGLPESPDGVPTIASLHEGLDA